MFRVLIQKRIAYCRAEQFYPAVTFVHESTPTLYRLFPRIFLLPRPVLKIRHQHAGTPSEVNDWKARQLRQPVDCGTADTQQPGSLGHVDSQRLHSVHQPSPSRISNSSSKSHDRALQSFCAVLGRTAFPCSTRRTVRSVSPVSAPSPRRVSP